MLGVKVGLTGLNHFRLLPAVNRGGGLPTALHAETTVLFTVFATTGVLSTSVLPYTGELTGVRANLPTFLAYLWAH